MFRRGFIAACAAVAFIVPASLRAEGPVRPATVAQAAKVLDLSTLELFESKVDPAHRTVAGLGYTSTAGVAQVFAAHQAALVKRGFKELPGTNVSEQYANGTFERDGFKVSLGAFPTGQPNETSVSILQHGNVDLAALPVPNGVKPLYAGPLSIMFVTAKPVAETQAACAELLTKQGWERYGQAGDSLVFRQNAVVLNAFITLAPAQDNQTAITYSTQLVSAELPAPAGAKGIQYSDSPTQLYLDTELAMDDVVVFYRKALGSAAWQATTDKPFRNGIYHELILRNPPKEMLTLQMSTVDERTRVLLKFETAAQVAKQDERARAAMKKGAEKPPGNTPDAEKLALTLPAGAKDVKAGGDEITFAVANGTAKQAVETLCADLKKGGWKEDAAEFQSVAGVGSFSNGERRITINYTDTGFLPAEVTINATGVMLEAQKPAQK